MPKTGAISGARKIFIILSSLLLVSLSFFFCPRPAFPADKEVEFGIVDDLTVQGEEGDLNDADVEIEGNTTAQRQIHINEAGLSTPFGGIGIGGNLLIYSEAFDNSAWTKTNLTASPETDDNVYAPNGQDGTAEVLSNSGASGGSVSQTVTSGVSPSTQYVFSVWLRAGTSTSTQIKIEDNDGQSSSYTIDALPNKWKRYEVSFTTGSSATQITVSVINTGADGSTIYAWGAQLEQASRPGVYVMTEANSVPELNGAILNGDLRLGNGTFDNPGPYSDLYITGNLEVDGTVYATIGDSSTIPGTASETFTVDTDNTGTEPAHGAGYVIEGGTGTNVNFLYDANNDRMTLNYPLLITDTESNTLMSVSDAGTTGDVTITGNTTIGGDLAVNGNSTLGDESTDAVIVNASTMSVPNNLNIDSNTLYIDAGNNRIGLGTTTPSEMLSLYRGNILQTLTGTSPVYQPLPLVSELSASEFSGAYGIYVRGKYAYVVSSYSSNDRLTVVDVSDPTSPKIIGSVNDTTNLDGAWRVFVVGDYAYVTCWSSDRLTVVDVSSPQAPTVVASITAPELAGARGLYVSGNYAYVAAYSADRLVVIDISSPTAPRLLGSVYDGTRLDGAMGVFVKDGYAYVCAMEGDYLTILDVSDPTSPTIVGGITDTQLDRPVDVYVSGSYAYVPVDSEVNEGFTIVDVSDPSNPSIVGHITDPLSFNDPRRVQVRGSYAFVGGGGGTAIVDVSDPANPVVVARGYQGSVADVFDLFLVGGILYTVGLGYLDIYNLYGLNTPGARIGTLASSSLTVTENAHIANDLYVDNGLIVGQGLLTQGVSSFMGDVRIGQSGDFDNPSSLPDLYVKGNLEVDGSVWLGDATTDDLTVAGTLNQNGSLKVGDGSPSAVDMSNASGEQDLFVTDDAEIGGDLTVNGTITSSGGITTNLTPGSVVFAGSGGQLSEDNTNLFWDDTNDRLGVGTNAPNYTLDVNGTASVASNATIGGTLDVTGDVTMSANASVAGNATIGGDLAVNGNSTLGNESTDAVIVNASTMSVPNNLNISGGDVDVDSNTLHVDATSNRVGVRTASPEYTLDINGSARIGIGASFGINIETLSGDKILTPGRNKMYQWLDPGDSRRIITLATTNAKPGDVFVIKNNAVFDNIRPLEIKVGGTTIDEIYARAVRTYIFDGSTWVSGDSGTFLYNTDEAISIGAGAKGWDSGVAIGISSEAYGSGIAVGMGARGSGSGVALGYQSQGVSSGIAVGYQASSYNYGIAIGFRANSDGWGIGLGSQAQGGAYGIGIGFEANGNQRGVAIGFLGQANDYGSAVGYSSRAFHQGASFGSYAGNHLISDALSVSKNKNILIGYKAGYNLTQPNTWQASTSYNVGDYVRPSTDNGYSYECITAGTSGDTEPTWPTNLGDTVTDGTVVWQCVEMRGNNNIFIGYDIEGETNDVNKLNIGNILYGTGVGSGNGGRIGINTDSWSIPAGLTVGNPVSGDPEHVSGVNDVYVAGDLEVNGTIYGTVASSAISDDSLDWDKFADNMTLDADTTIDMSSGSSYYDLDFDSDDHLLYIDSENNRIGVLTNAPNYTLDVNGTANVAGDTTIGGDLAVNGGDITSTSTTINITPADGGTVNVTDGTNTLLSVSDAGNVGNVTVTGDLAVNGNSTLGNESTDAVIVNASTMSVPNNLNIDSNTLYIDSTNDRVGIGTNNPDAKLHILAPTQQLTIGYDGTNYWTDTVASDGGRTIAGFGTDADLNVTLTGAVDGDFSINAYDLFVDSSSGNLGVGTNSPSETLTVKPWVFTSVQYYDSSTTSYVDDTNEAGKVGGTPYTVLSTSSDQFFVGMSGRKFDAIYFDLAQAGSGLTLTAEYYNGTGWSALTITDGTSNLTQDGAITFTPPSDWAETDVNGVTAYWVRLSTSGVTTPPTAYLTVPSSADRLAVYAQSNDDSPALKVDKLGNVIVSGEGTFELQGNARHVKVVRLSPEYANVVFYADGTNNLGTLTSGVDTQNNHYYTYYQWSTSQTTLQDYDIYVRWPVPMEFDGFPVGTDDALVIDIATATTSSADNAVDVTLYKDGIAGSSSVTDKVSTTAGVWMTDQEGTAVIKFDDSDAVLSSLSAGDVLIIRITLKANDTNSGWAKVGSMRIKYLSKW